jgi:hypothetical protein
MSEIDNQENVVYYDIQWDKVKTVKDIKAILQVLASKVIINHSDEEDVEVYETLKDFLTVSDEQ